MTRRPCVVVTDYPEESDAAAVARYRDERPETPEHARFLVIATGIDHAPGEGKEAAIMTTSLAAWRTASSQPRGVLTRPS